MKHLILLLILLTSSFTFCQNSEEHNKSTPEEKTIIIEKTRAHFEGGTPALIKFLSENLQFSEKDMGGLKSAKVEVYIRIPKTGEIKETNIRIIKHVNEALDKEALRIIKLMPYWVPATENGERVPCNIVLPITFMI